MDGEQREGFLAALQTDDANADFNYQSIMASISSVDARKAECRNKVDQDAILRELDERVGLSECNKMVQGKLRGAVVLEGRAALYAMAEEERATSPLQRNVGRLLQEMV